MSRLIPAGVVAALKSQNDVTVRISGIDCILYTVLNYQASVSKDAYSEESDKTFDNPIKTTIWIAWDPERTLLQRYGLFYDKDSPRPILSRFLSVFNPPEGSYIKIETKFRPAAYDVDEFEIVSRHTGKTHDEVILPVYKLAPRRVKAVLGERIGPTAVPLQPAIGAYN